MEESIDRVRTDAQRLRTMGFSEASEIILRKTEGRFAFPVSDRIKDTTHLGGVRMTIEVGLCKVDAIVHEVEGRQDIESCMYAALDAGEGPRLPDAVTLVAAGIPGERESLDDLFVIQCGRKPVLLVTLPVSAEFSGKVDNLDPVTALIFKRAKEDYLPLMRLLSAITVRDVKMVLDAQTKVDPSFTKDEIRIYPNSTPPGESSTENVAALYGIPLDARLVQYVCPRAVPGRGRVAKDVDGTDVVQVVGDDFYVLFPIFALHNEGSATILRKALADAYTLWKKGAPEASHDPEIILNTVGGIEELSLEICEKNLLHHASEIDRLNEKLVHAYASHTIEVKRLALLKQLTFANSRERAAADHAAIKADHRVERIEAVEKGLHVITKKVVVEYEGERYALGSYTLRIGQFGRISIWTNGPKHPFGIAHPHIDPGSGPCYGNAGQTIIRATGEGRIGDAVHFALSWLFEGYDDHVARTKIVEWPKADENGDPLPMPSPKAFPGFTVQEKEQITERAFKMLEEQGSIDIGALMPKGTVGAVDEDHGSLDVVP